MTHLRKILLILLLGSAGLSHSQEVVTLDYMNFTISEIPFEQVLIDEFEALHPNIEINVITRPVDVFDRQIILSSQAGQAPDVFQARPSYTTSLGKLGLMADLSGRLKDDPVFADQFTDAGMKLGILGDQFLGVPFRGGAWAVYVNQDIFDGLGLKVPAQWTWGEFVESAQVVSESSDGMYGFAFAGDPSDLGTAQSWAAQLAANGGALFDAQGNPAIDSPEAIRALEQYLELVERGIAPANSHALRYQDIVELFGRGRVAMFVNGPWFVATVKKAYPDVNLTIAALPMDQPNGSVISGTLLSMAATTEHPDEAWQFIKFLTERKNLLRWGEAGQFVPPLADTSGAAYLDEPPFDTFVAMEQLPGTVQVGNLPNATELLRSLGNAIQAALLGAKGPAEALQATAAEWKNIINQ